MNMAAPFGHNETAVRLGLLASDAILALEQVARGEGDAIAGWLAYGAALNAGRALFPSDEEFGQWLVSGNLAHTERHERAAAMWAAANPDDFETAHTAGNARTVRGIYSKWQEIDAERKAVEERHRAAAERAKADAERAEAKARADAEAAARTAEREAKDEAARLAARLQAEQEAKAKAEAEKRASAADKKAKSADKKAKSADKKVAKAKAGSAAETGSPFVSHNSGENEWYTPAPLIAAARAVMGGIDLDPASSEVANRTVQAARFFTAEDDGLAQEWPVGRIWMNPPYAKGLIEPFARRLADEVAGGSDAIVLVNNATETEWFQVIGAACSAMCFPKARVRFLDPDGIPGSPLQGQVVLYCGPNAAAFEAAFRQFGLVVQHG